MHQIIGVIVIINGALYCLPIVTAILGVPFIIIGLKMFKSGGEYKKSLVTLGFPKVTNELLTLNYYRENSVVKLHI